MGRTPSSGRMMKTPRDALVLDAWSALKGAAHAVWGRIGKDPTLEKVGATPAQVGFLRLLMDEDAPRTPQAIAQRLDVTPATVTALLNRLEDADLLARTRDSEDRRVVHVHVTPEGRALVHRWIATFHGHIQTALAPLGDDELRTLVTLLNRVGPPIHGPPGGFGAILRQEGMRRAADADEKPARAKKGKAARKKGVK